MLRTKNVRATVRARLSAAVDAAGLDEDRARAWCLVHTMVTLARGLASRRQEEEWLTRDTVTAKALAS